MQLSGIGLSSRTGNVMKNKRAPFFLLIWQILEESDMPLSILQVKDKLEEFGYHTTERSVMNRLSELAMGTYAPIMIKRIHRSVYCSIKWYEANKKGR